MAKTKSTAPSIPSTDKPAINSEQQNIIDWLKKVRFRKQLFGGVSEQDVWKKIDELNKLYDAALAAERIRYETLIAETKAGTSLSKERSGDD